MISAACSQLLDRAAVYGPLYGNDLSNHLPMALVALDRMGASPTRLEQFYARYASRLVRRRPPAAPLQPNHSFGVMSDFEGVLAYFREQIAERGKEPVLRAWLPFLIPGVAASAFHALIRLAYAVDAYHDGEIAAGLACWVTEYQRLGELGAPTRRSLDDIVGELSQRSAAHRFNPGLIVDRMADAAQLPAVLAAATQPEHLQFADVANFAIRMYAACGDFTVLHMVTGCHALRIISPYLEDPAAATRHLWHAVMLAFLSTGLELQRTDRASAAPRHDWPQCLGRAVESDNDHVVKLTYTAWREAAVTHDPLYHYAACRVACGTG